MRCYARHEALRGRYLPRVKAVCPLNPSHGRFETTAHVVQSWEVAADGTFVSSFEDLEVAHGPDAGNIWTCLECQSSATVYRDDEAAATAVAAMLGEQAYLKVEPGRRQRLSGLAERRR